MTRWSPLPQPRFGMPSDSHDPAATTGHPGAVDVTVTAWAADLTAPASRPCASATTTVGADGFVDFDVIDSVHAGSQVPTVVLER